MDLAEVTAATGAYWSAMDVLGDFLADCTRVEPGSQTTSAALSRPTTSGAKKTANGQ